MQLSNQNFSPSHDSIKKILKTSIFFIEKKRLEIFEFLFSIKNRKLSVANSDYPLVALKSYKVLIDLNLESQINRKIIYYSRQRGVFLF